uniref:U11-Eretoxin-Ek1ai_1 n=1 Tax=Eresus cinnaberinus TaxID=175337 RepID=A0A2D0PCG4_ERECI
MVSHMTSIVLLFALFLGLVRMRKNVHMRSSPHSTVSAKIQILNVLFWNRITTSSQTTPCRLTQHVQRESCVR